MHPFIVFSSLIVASIYFPHDGPQVSRFRTLQVLCVCVCLRITFGLSPSLSFPGWPEPRTICLCFLLQPLLQTRLCALRQTDNCKKIGQGLLTVRGEKYKLSWHFGVVRLSNEGSYQVGLCALLLSLFFTRLFRLLLISHLHRKKRFNSSHAQTHHTVILGGK